jgi:DNA-binding IclR family transcriptional regulator
VLGIGAPVRGENGAVIAALSIAALSHREPDREVARYAKFVLEAVRGLSEQVARRGAA